LVSFEEKALLNNEKQVGTGRPRTKSKKSFLGNDISGVFNYSMYIPT
jgi:hypothetical protein